MLDTVTTKLSICISTFNRAAFIGATIESILCQLTSDCELIVVDGGSTDDTEDVVSRYTSRFDRCRYVRQSANGGVDRDFDRAVELARGEYCWLFSDDDLLKPEALTTVLRVLERDYSVVLINGEHRDFEMSRVRVPSFFGISSDHTYSGNDLDRLFSDIGTCLMCICCIVIKRALWLARNRERYYGSRFVHVGVIFQEPLPGPIFVLEKPLMSLRLGNTQTAEVEHFKVWYIDWPALIWSLPLLPSTKTTFCRAEPWRRFTYLLAYRATGQYSMMDYQRWLRPRLRSVLERLAPILIAYLPRRVAERVYPLCAIASGAPRSPLDMWWTLFPSSLKTLQTDPARAHCDSRTIDESSRT
jgi:abequosyltransferase